VPVATKVIEVRRNSPMASLRFSRTDDCLNSLRFVDCGEANSH
jgi:hypothetical protein